MIGYLREADVAQAYGSIPEGLSRCWTDEHYARELGEALRDEADGAEDAWAQRLLEDFAGQLGAVERYMRRDDAERARVSTLYALGLYVRHYAQQAAPRQGCSDTATRAELERLLTGAGERLGDGTLLAFMWDTDGVLAMRSTDDTPRLGRPVTAARTRRVGFRVSETELADLQRCADAMGSPLVEVLVEGVRLVKDKLGL
ncbi:hypothetical protein [Stomatobaculum longum]|uniref:hypothetical protein n=1 Tax=Stomatobaculum longum TaxID=796942 RepID=UPI0028DBE63C|nr:hypothetical protein [Stomatobaculum longum]